MTELNKKSFYFHLLKQGGGKIDPRIINFMIDTLKEWLPTEHETNSYKWNECIRMIRENLR